MQQTFRTLAKPNQIINRQEIILNMINSTIKSERFLRSFVELQHSANSALRTSKVSSSTAQTNKNASSKQSSKQKAAKKQKEEKN